MNQLLGVRKTTKSILSVVYIIQVILTVPLSFEVGGNKCGLAFTFMLTLLYALSNSLRIIAMMSPGNNRLKPLRFLFYLQHLFIPSLLILFLSIFTNPSDFKSLYMFNLSSMIGGEKVEKVATAFQKLLETYILVWDFIIKKLTAVFIIVEGICTLLLIQAIGKSFNWLMYKSHDSIAVKSPNPSTPTSSNLMITSTRSDYQILLNLLVSGTILTISFYFLFNVFTIPNLEINLFSSTLLGAIITYCLGLALYGIISSKGSLIESVLIFAYVVKCIYQTFPKLTTSTNNSINELISQTTSNFKSEFDKNIVKLFSTDWFTKNYFISFYQLNFKQILFPKSGYKEFFDTPSFVKSAKNGSTIVIILTNLKIFLKIITLNLTSSFLSLFTFMVDAVRYLTISSVFNLAFRILVFYAATRIIPALKSQIKSINNSRVMMSEEDSGEPSDYEVNKKLYIDPQVADVFSISSESTGSSKPQITLHKLKVRSSSSSIRSMRSNNANQSKGMDKMKIVYSFSPCVIIAVYTNLMLLQRNEIEQNLVIWGWWMDSSEQIAVNQLQFWNWLNMLVLLGLYTVELLSED